MLVNKAQAEAAWPHVAHQFPGVDIAYGDEDEAGMASLSISEGSATPESIAYAMGVAPGPGVNVKVERSVVQDDFIDHGRERKRKDLGLVDDSETKLEDDRLQELERSAHVDAAPEAEPQADSAEEVSAGAQGKEVVEEEAPPPKKKAAKASKSKSAKK